jgi:superfamily I DNA and/or RNA helicase
MGALGWLFIDEAGQTVPQAAVGALWRSRRAVVIGDPLQIEPVFSIPVKLIEALNRSTDPAADPVVQPHRSSVQTMADLSNGLGTWTAAREDSPDRKWIGSPLRVHRRCQDPMFGIANSIAYGGKMVHGLENRTPPGDPDPLGDSAWVHVPGATSDKQVVPEQVALVTEAVVARYLARGELPQLYVISPFKRVGAALRAGLEDPEHWRRLSAGPRAPRKYHLQKWCRERIGTVHTFQGKEAPMVWMVLGCDASRIGAVQWASEKPNLLNVAVTRAKHRFFIIGDVGLWGDARFFQIARQRLPILSSEEFLRKAGALGPSSIRGGARSIREERPP